MLWFLKSCKENLNFPKPKSTARFNCWIANIPVSWALHEPVCDWEWVVHVLLGGGPASLTKTIATTAVWLRKAARPNFFLASCLVTQANNRLVQPILNRQEFLCCFNLLSSDLIFFNKGKICVIMVAFVCKRCACAKSFNFFNFDFPTLRRCT